MSVTNQIISPTLLSTSILNEPQQTEIQGSHEHLGREFESLFFSLMIKNIR